MVMVNYDEAARMYVPFFLFTSTTTYNPQLIQLIINENKNNKQT